MDDNGNLVNPDCDECTAYEENPAEYVEQEICPICPWAQEIQEPIIYKLMDFIALLNAGCPVERHELTNDEWRAVGILKAEFEKLAVKEAKEKGERDGR